MRHRHSNLTPRWIIAAWLMLLTALALYLPHTAGAVSLHRERALTKNPHGHIRPLAPKPADPTLIDDIAAARAYWGWSRSAQCSTEEFSEGQFMWAGMEEAEGTMLRPGRCWLQVLALPLIESHLRNLEPGDEGYAPSRLLHYRALELRCRIAVHEYGHMLGLGHDPSESSPMYWRMTFKPIVPDCEARISVTKITHDERQRR